jgi:VWFA-related protein
MSFGSIYYARRGLKRFAEREFRPGDLAMLATTSASMGYHPVVTSSSIELEAAVKRLRYSLWSAYDAGPLDRGMRIAGGRQEQDFYERTLGMDAVAEVEAVIGLLRPMPGRKSVTLVSEGFKLFGPGMDNNLMRDVLHRLVDVANRAGVVIYTLDPRGLVAPGVMADNTSVDEAVLRDSQDGLRFLAAETGGFAVVDSNDLAGGMRRIVSDQAGYYLIGYQPEAGTVRTDGSGRYLKVRIKVKPKGLRVRTRSGFYGNASE